MKMRGATLLNALQYQPSTSWLASALLVSPKVSTLVGRHLPDFALRLESFGMWERGHLSIGPGEADDIVQRALELSAEHRAAGQSLSKSMSAESKGYILEDKAGYSLTHALLASGLATRSTDRHGGSLFPIEGDRAFLDCVLYLGGVHLASERGWRLDVSTRSEATMALAPTAMDHPDPQSDGTHPSHKADHDSVSLDVSNSFPSTAPGVELNDVITFRQNHQDEFQAFTSALDRLTESTVDSVEANWIAYQSTLADFTRAATSRRVAIRLESRTLALAHIDRLKWGESKQGIGSSVTKLALGTGVAFSASRALQDFITLDQGALVAGGSALALAFIRMRAASPTAFLRRAARDGLIGA